MFVLCVYVPLVPNYLVCKQTELMIYTLKTGLLTNNFSLSRSPNFRMFLLTRKLNKNVVFIIGGIGVVYVVLKFFDNFLKANEEVQLSLDNMRTKRILYYNPPSWFSDFDFGHCRYSSCVISTNMSYLPESDAVIFNHNQLSSVPPIKTPNQKWIFTCSESPYYGKKTSSEPEWRHKFDWVMSFRRDSEFFFGYGDIVPKTRFIEKNYEKIFEQKKKLVAWIASHCDTQSKREQYVHEMSKIEKVDVFGSCGNLKCEKYTGSENDSCHDFVGKNYKFYLAFENSLCRDYTSEKFYNVYAFDHPIIPVVLGSFTLENYSHGAVYIDVNKYRTPLHLTRRLLSLGNDKEAYIDLLRKKDRFSALTSPQTFRTAMCKMCEYLSLDKPGRSDLDIADWFYGQDHCRSPKQIHKPVTRNSINMKEAQKYLNKV